MKQFLVTVQDTLRDNRPTSAVSALISDVTSMRLWLDCTSPVYPLYISLKLKITTRRLLCHLLVIFKVIFANSVDPDQ